MRSLVRTRRTSLGTIWLCPHLQSVVSVARFVICSTAGSAHLVSPTSFRVPCSGVCDVMLPSSIVYLCARPYWFCASRIISFLFGVWMPSCGSGRFEKRYGVGSHAGGVVYRSTVVFDYRLPFPLFRLGPVSGVFFLLLYVVHDVFECS